MDNQVEMDEMLMGIPISEGLRGQEGTIPLYDSSVCGWEDGLEGARRSRLSYRSYSTASIQSTPDDRLRDPDYRPRDSGRIKPKSKSTTRKSKSPPRDVALVKKKLSDKSKSTRNTHAQCNNNLTEGSDNLPKKLSQPLTSQVDGGFARYQNQLDFGDLANQTNKMKQLKRKCSRPGGLGSNDLQQKRSKNEKNVPDSSVDTQGENLSSNIQEDQSQPQNGNANKWFSTVAEELGNIKLHESFFKLNEMGDNLDDAIFLLRLNELTKEQVNIMFDKLISEGKDFIKVEDSRNKKRIEHQLKDLEAKREQIQYIINQRIIKLRNCKNCHEVEGEVRSLKKFIDESLKEIAQRLEDDEAVFENRQEHELLGKKMQWIQGINLIQNMKQRAKPVCVKSQVSERLETVKTAWDKLTCNFENESTFYQFLTACDECCEYFQKAEANANNEDYGENAEKTEALLRDFQIIKRTASKKYDDLDDLAKSSSEEGHPYSQKMKKSMKDVTEKKIAFHEIADARLIALTRTKEVYIFNKKADETIKLIEDKKKLVLDSSNDYGVDLTKLANQRDKYVKLEKSLNKLDKDELRKVIEEALKLEKEFPEVKDQVIEKRDKCLKVQKELRDLLEDRMKQLRQAEDLQKYFDKWDEVKEQITSATQRLNSIEPCRNLEEARENVATCEDTIDENNRYREENEHSMTKEGCRLLQIIQIEALKKELNSRIESLRKMWDKQKSTADEVLMDSKQNLEREVEHQKMQERSAKRRTGSAPTLD